MIVLRRFKEEDRPWVVDTFVQSYRGSRAVRGMDDDDYHMVYRRKVNDLVDRSEFVVAAAEDDEDTILGWVMFQNVRNHVVVHFVHVRRELRKRGLAREMIQAVEPTCFSHWSTRVRQIPDGWRYRPDLAW